MPPSQRSLQNLVVYIIVSESAKTNKWKKWIKIKIQKNLKYWEQNRVAVIETVLSIKPRPFTIYPFTEKILATHGISSWVLKTHWMGGGI